MNYIDYGGYKGISGAIYLKGNIHYFPGGKGFFGDCMFQGLIWQMGSHYLGIYYEVKRCEILLT